jgi:ribosomal-protein-alanine N-acetyltransferase
MPVFIDRSAVSEVLIREMALSDVLAIARLAEEGFRDFYQFDWQANAQALVKASASGKAFVAVAEIKGEVVGYCNLRSWPAGGWIDQIVVDERHRRAGVGRLLLDVTIKTAIQKGFWKISLIVSKSDSAALSFYAKQGFEVVGRMKDKIKKGLDGILLSYITSYELHPNR